MNFLSVADMDPYDYVENPTISSDSQLAGSAASLYRLFSTLFFTGVVITLILGFITIMLSKTTVQRSEAKKNIIFKIFLVSLFATAVPGCGLLIDVITHIF